MPIGETLLGAITAEVFSYVLAKARPDDRLRKKLRRTSTHNAFQRALGVAASQLKQKHQQWVDALFDLSFLKQEGASILAQLLLPDGHPHPSELAERWAASINILQPQQRSTYIREVEPVAADFLNDLARALKAEPDLRDLNNSRALDQVAEDIHTLRQLHEADKATPGTRQDYLQWVISQHSYLDPRGIPQSQHPVQVKLDEVYIPLHAEREDASGAVARHPPKQDILEGLKELKASMDGSQLTDEESEGLQELLFARFEHPDLNSATNEVLELEEVVKRYERVVILGDPGSGKTTLLRYLALKHAQALQHDEIEAGGQSGEARFPILIRIADYAEGGVWKEKSLSDFLAPYCALHECPKSGLADLLETELKNGHCLVLFDGLDKIVDADDRRGVVQHIDEFVRRHSSRPNRFVITSRSAAYRSGPLGAVSAHYTVRAMDDEQIRRFLERWCLAVEATQTPDKPLAEREAIAQREINGILKAVKDSAGVRRLATNPLLLCTLALIHRTGAQLPQKRVELYKLAAEVLTRTWQMAQGLRESDLVKDEYLIPLLSKLAHWLHETKPTGLATEQEVYTVLGEEWAEMNDLSWDKEHPNPTIMIEIKRFLVVVNQHTGIFVERAPHRYGFLHLTFEEYYVARYLIALSRKRPALIRQHLHDPRWEEPILLALGLVGLESPQEATSLVETAILAEGGEAKTLDFAPSLYEALLGFDYLFALRCLADQIPINIRLMRRLVERLADELLHQTGPAQFQRYRQALFRRLEALKGGRAVYELSLGLIAALQDKKVEVRRRAAENLGSLGQATEEVLTALRAALHDDDLAVCYVATESLRHLGQAPPIASVTHVAQYETTSKVRYVETENLKRLGQTPPEAITSLLRVLSDKEAGIRSEAAENLDLQDQTSYAILLDGLQNSKAWKTRRSCADYLGQMGEADEPTIRALWRGLLDTDNDVRAACATALARLGRRFPASTRDIAEKLEWAIKDPEFDETDIMNRSAHDYAYDGLWQLVENGQHSRLVADELF